MFSKKFLLLHLPNLHILFKLITNEKLLLISGATLTFDVELMNISDSPPTANVFKEIDANKDNQLSREEVRAMARSL